MQCLRCGSQNKATNEYCEGCGATLGIECKACGHLNGPNKSLLWEMQRRVELILLRENPISPGSMS